MPAKKQTQSGFTIVELLIVVVVIAILAAITIVAFNGIQNRAKASVLQSDLKNAKTQLESDKVLVGSYPTALDQANGGNGLSKSSETTYRYTASDATFCLTAFNGNIIYRVSNNTGIEEGACAGHSVPGSTSGMLTWTERTSAGSREWRSIASSSDGSRLVAVVSYGYIYTSTDSGATWAERTSAGSRAWQSVSSSSDGTRLVATSANNDYIYTSQDSGVTWAAQTSAGLRQWGNVASSADGRTLITSAEIGMGNKNIFTSSNYGQAWVERTQVAPGYSWSVAVSADGSRMFAANGFWGGAFYRSTDSGASWTNVTGAGTGFWRSLAVSGDGTKMIASRAEGEYDTPSIYTSVNTGTSWTMRSSLQPQPDTWPTWEVASSLDGDTVVAVGDSNLVHTSVDGGATWIEQSTLPLEGYDLPKIVAISGNGNRVVVANFSGYIYTGAYE